MDNVVAILPPRERGALKRIAIRFAEAGDNLCQIGVDETDRAGHHLRSPCDWQRRGIRAPTAVFFSPTRYVLRGAWQLGALSRGLHGGPLPSLVAATS